MTLEYFAAVVGIISAVAALAYFLIKLCIKLSAYFDKVDRLDKGLQGLSTRLVEAGKEQATMSAQLDVLLAERYGRFTRRKS
jgi:hypothetical protein